MTKLDRRLEMAELDDDASEGQMADYFASELSGEMGAWGMGVVEYECRTCGATIEVISDELANYGALIGGWHKKANATRADYFSKYMFEYLAFNAYLKSSIAVDANSDRGAIQNLKRNTALRDKYLAMMEKDKTLLRHWSEIIDELKRRPLRNSSKDYDYPEIDGWWNTSENNIATGSDVQKGVIHSLSDWQNMIEYWYGIRNDLFHAGKDPSIKRDMFLVEHAFKTLSAFMTLVLKTD